MPVKVLNKHPEKKIITIMEIFRKNIKKVLKITQKIVNFENINIKQNFAKIELFYSFNLKFFTYYFYFARIELFNSISFKIFHILFLFCQN